MKDFVVYIKTEILENMDDDEVAVYPFVKAICSSGYADQIPVCVEAVSYSMYGGKTLKRTRDKISEAIINMINSGIIKGTIVSSSFFLIESMSEANDKFVKIHLNDLTKILHSDLVKKTSYIHYYILLMASCTNGKYGFRNIEYFAHVLGVCDRTIMRYNEALEGLNLIYVRRSYSYQITPSGYFFRNPNVYGRPENKDYIDSYVDKHDGKALKSQLQNRDQLSSHELSEVNKYIRSHNELELSYKEKNPQYIPQLLD